MTDTLDRRRSVTRGDFALTAEPGGVWNWSVYDPGAIQSPTVQLPVHGDPLRDAVLVSTLDLEDMWASAVNKAVTKIAVRGYEVSDSDDSARRTEKGKSLIMNFDGPSEYRSGMAKTVQDFLLCDNGWFVEVERENKNPASRPRALYHLDSFRCYRTGNLDYPVLYWDWMGKWHKIPAASIIFGSDMPSARSRMFNKGRCAASRAFQTIVKLAAVETYFREKITGSRALALHFIAGVGPKQIQDAMETSEAEKVRKGQVVYKGAVMVPVMAQGTEISIATIDLASVPDGFDVDQERRDAYLRYANALGVPVQDIQPLSGQGLGTGTQTVILDEAAEGQGLAFFVKDFEDKVNNLLMPKTTVFSIKANDIRDQQAQAALDLSKAQKLTTLLGSGQAPGVISPQMALQMAVDDGLVPREFLPEDVTPEGVLTDSGDQSKPVGQVFVAPYAGAPNPVAAQPVVTKASDFLAPIDNEEVIRQLVAANMEYMIGQLKAARATPDDEWQEAVKWAEEASE